MAEEKPLSIGEVINLLRDDFPDVSVSKIRFLESQGLIDPGRSPSGYRQFDGDDIARLRFILQQQRDHFLPLKVIKSKLTLWERGEAADEPEGASRRSLSEEGEPLDMATLLKRSGLSEEEARALIDAGLLRSVKDSTVFPAEAGVVGAEAKRLMEHGLEPRHLRAIRLGVDREADVLIQLVSPLAKASNAESNARAREVLESCAESVRVIHKALLSSELRQELG